MSTNKPRVVKDYEKLEHAIQEQIKLAYPFGFHRNLVTYTDQKGKLVSALPFETDDRYYLVRMSVSEAKALIEDDDDYDDDGILKDSVKESYEDKYSDLDYISKNLDETDVAIEEEDENEDSEDMDFEDDEDEDDMSFEEEEEEEEDEY